MIKSEYITLMLRYGSKNADLALKWFIRNHSIEFRRSVNQANYCMSNQLLWLENRAYAIQSSLFNEAAR